MIINQDWLAKQHLNDETGKPLDPLDDGDAYVLCIVKCAEKGLELLEALPAEEAVNAESIVHACSQGEGITGNMAGYVAYIITKCHSRGEEFKRSWNTGYGRPDAEGVINPAIMTIG